MTPTKLQAAMDQIYGHMPAKHVTGYSVEANEVPKKQFQGHPKQFVAGRIFRLSTVITATGMRISPQLDQYKAVTA